MWTFASALFHVKSLNLEHSSYPQISFLWFKSLPGSASGNECRRHKSSIPVLWVLSLGRGDLLEKEMAIHSSILAWRIPWTEEPGGLQSVGLQRVGDDSAQQHILWGGVPGSGLCTLLVCSKIILYLPLI